MSALNPIKNLFVAIGARKIETSAGPSTVNFEAALVCHLGKLRRGVFKRVNDIHEHITEFISVRIRQRIIGARGR